MSIYEGGCHCRAIRFRVTVAKDEHIAWDCNCSMCRMKANLHLIVAKAAFELLSGADAITTYRFNTGVAKHTFCRVCGIHPFYTPRSHPDGVSVNLRCLDGDAMTRFEVRRFDGDQWESNVDKIR